MHLRKCRWLALPSVFPVVFLALGQSDLGEQSVARSAAAAEVVARAASAPSPRLDAASLRRAFEEPPAEYRPLVIAHAGPLRDAPGVAWFEARRAGGVVLDAGIRPGSPNIGDEPWNNPTYLDDPEQFGKLREAMCRFRQAGQRVWLYDELGYPSGSAGGRVLAGRPEFQVEVIGCRTLRVQDGESVEVASRHGSVLACYAMPWLGDRCELERAEDLTARLQAGQFTWRSPGGPWAVCVFERFQPETWRRHNIPRRNVNILDRRAVTRFLELTHERYARELEEQLAEVDAFFTDEPQFGSAEHWGGGLPESIPMVQWCDELPAAFLRQKGYELTRVLPALFFDVGPRTPQYRFDFYDVQSDLVAENYFGQIEDWCRRHGVASSGHMLLEESLLFHVMFSGSMLKNWARMDLPGVDLLGASPYKTMAGWNQEIVPVAEDYSCKMASSVAHLLGKQGTFTESFAVAQGIGLRQVLGVTAWQFAGGITHMSTYSIQQILPAEDYARFSQFAGRLAVLGRRGRHVADVAVLVPEASVWATYNPPDGGLFRRYLTCNPEALHVDRVFRDTCHALLRTQHDFDTLSEDLVRQAEMRSGKLHCGGEAFGVLVLPEVRLLRRETLSAVQRFVAAGGRVAFVGQLPSLTPSQETGPDVRRAVESLLADAPRQTVHWPYPDALDRLPVWLDEQRPAAVRWRGSASVRLLQRSEGEREILLVANPSAEPAEGVVLVPAAGVASLWDPESGAIRDLGNLPLGESVDFRVPAETAWFLVIETTGASP